MISARRSPWQNPFVERVIGSIRRECTDHVIALGEDHLRRVLNEYVDYYNRSRTHLSLDGNAPLPREVEPIGDFVAEPGARRPSSSVSLRRVAPQLNCSSAISTVAVRPYCVGKRRGLEPSGSPRYRAPLRTAPTGASQKLETQPQEQPTTSRSATVD